MVRLQLFKSVDPADDWSKVPQMRRVKDAVASNMIFLMLCSLHNIINDHVLQLLSTASLSIPPSNTISYTSHGRDSPSSDKRWRREC